MKPPRHILSKAFQYTKSHDTDIRKTFEKAREQWKKKSSYPVIAISLAGGTAPKEAVDEKPNSDTQNSSSGLNQDLTTTKILKGEG